MIPFDPVCFRSCETLRVVRAVTPAKGGESVISLDEVAHTLVGGFNFPMNVSKGASVQFFVDERGHFAEPLDGFVVAEREADIINLATNINSLWVWQKKDTRNWKVARHDVEKRTIRLFPHGMKLCLNEYLWPFPDRPTNNAHTTSGCNLTINKMETFIKWCARPRLARNINWSSVRNNTAAKPQHVGLNELGWTHKDIEQSNVIELSGITTSTGSDTVLKVNVSTGPALTFQHFTPSQHLYYYVFSML